MKKHIYLGAFLISVMTAGAQDTGLNSASDAVRYSVDNLTGTARFRAMSGAFGALGGDVSAMGINPAGSAVFNYNTGTISLTSFNKSNQANYFGSKTRQNDNSFELNQFGGVFVFNNANPDATIQKFTLGFNYDNTNNFDNSIYSQGINPDNAIANYFVNNANGVSVNTLNNAFYGDLNLRQQQAYLGYNAFVFNPVAAGGGNTAYIADPNIAASNGYYQENALSTRGYNGKIGFNFATQIKNWLYLGANLNLHLTDLIQTSSFYERYNVGSNSGLQALRFNNERYTYGGGFSFNVGAIAKVTEQFRAGLAYESPTWMRLQDEISQSLVSNCPECDLSAENTFTADPGFTFILDDYTIQTPAKYTGSLAYIFGKKGLVSVDYTLKDYGTTKFRNDGYEAINNELSSTLDLAGELRVGAEYRIKAFSLRGGYRFEQSPYKNGQTMGDLTGFSGGFGYAFGFSRIDLAYSYYQRSTDLPLYSPGFTDAARVKTTNNNVTLSYTIDL